MPPNLGPRAAHTIVLNHSKSGLWTKTGGCLVLKVYLIIDIIYCQISKSK